ncbi:DNA polymerase III subunit epsilon [Sphingomonas sp.]|uniref:DNA polymerase III subunit epsilon n=1 Tax=Sphingomonas sp. TaxID=28214 RepID=UPI001E143A06|nr:DNA polymerase III subunit epsilon [Sphingomonas sp.]MBX9795520.1 DNA polymerase III subunit epsilon [Sphingomonas sp.]
MREIVFDTETTGLSFSAGDRLVEFGAIELVHRVPTGARFHRYFNPERAMPAEAQAVHGLSDAFLADKPLFADEVAALLDFLGDSPLVAHNAGFDFGFMNGELRRLGLAPLGPDRMVDTLQLARVRHPGAKHTLDALCSRYGIDRSHRVLHGALLDAELLAQVYVELTGGRQIGLGLAEAAVAPEPVPAAAAAHRQARPPRHFAPSDAERAAHAAFLETIKAPLWLADG